MDFINKKDYKDKLDSSRSLGIPIFWSFETPEISHNQPKPRCRQYKTQIIFLSFHLRPNYNFNNKIYPKDWG